MWIKALCNYQIACPFPSVSDEPFCKDFYKIRYRNSLYTVWQRAWVSWLSCVNVTAIMNVYRTFDISWALVKFSIVDLDVMLFTVYEFRASRFSKSYTVLRVAWIFSPVCYTLLSIVNVYKNLLGNCDLCGRWCSESHALVKGHERISLYIFHILSDWSYLT